MLHRENLRGFESRAYGTFLMALYSRDPFVDDHFCQFSNSMWGRDVSPQLGDLLALSNDMRD
jgi:hypothetical protein